MAQDRAPQAFVYDALRTPRGKGKKNGSLHEVKYVPSLPKVREMAGLRAEDVLTYKTKDWEYEAEYRLIREERTVDIAGRIRRVMLGTRSSELVEELLSKVIPTGAELVRMRLDHEGGCVEVGPVIYRNV